MLDRRRCAAGFAGCLAVVARLLIVAPVAGAETQAQIAAHENTLGEGALRKRQYDVASRHFRNAAARVPEPRYFYNLCQSLDGEAKFVEAITSCNAVEQTGGTAALVAKAKALIDKIRDHAKAAGVELHTNDQEGLAPCGHAPFKSAVKMHGWPDVGFTPCCDPGAEPLDVGMMRNELGRGSHHLGCTAVRARRRRGPARRP
jgi:hypothetical protein